MIKDTFFSLPRFMNLCRKEMVENWRSNVLRMVLMYGVMAVVMVWNGYFEYRYWHSGQIEDPAWTFLLVVFIFSIVNEALKQPNPHKDQIKTTNKNVHAGSSI